MALEDLIALAGETVEETLAKLLEVKQADLSAWEDRTIDALIDTQAPRATDRARLCAALVIAVHREPEFLSSNPVRYLRLLRFALGHGEDLETTARTILLDSLRRFLSDRRADPAMEALQLDREDVVNSVLLERGEVRPAFRDLPYTQRFVDQWHMRERMDQALYQAIVAQLCESAQVTAPEQTGVRRMRRRIECRWWATLGITLGVLIGGHTAAGCWVAIRPWLAVVIYLLVLMGVVLAICCGLCGRRANALRWLMPRLSVSLAVGYAALALTEEAWAFPLTATPWAWGLLALAALVASALYLFRQAADRLRDRGLAWRRARFLMLQTLATSLVIGTFVTAFFGYTSLPEDVLLRAQGTSWQGVRRAILLPAPFTPGSEWHLTLSPELTIFFACMALFIGVFLQLLWEKEPVTEPLA